MAAWRYEISLRELKNIPLVRCAHSWNIFQHSKRNFVFLRGPVISSVFQTWNIPYRWFSITWWDGHFGAQNNSKSCPMFCIIIDSNSQKTFLSIVLCTKMAAVTSGQNHLFTSLFNFNKVNYGTKRMPESSFFQSWACSRSNALFLRWCLLIQMYFCPDLWLCKKGRSSQVLLKSKNPRIFQR